MWSGMVLFTSSVPFGRDAMSKANNYEYRIFHFLVSGEFDLISLALLLAKSIQTIKVVWHWVEFFGK